MDPPRLWPEESTTSHQASMSALFQPSITLMLLLLSQLLTHTGEGNEHLELLTKEYLKNAADKCNELFNEGESEILESANATM